MAADPAKPANSSGKSASMPPDHPSAMGGAAPGGHRADGAVMSVSARGKTARRRGGQQNRRREEHRRPSVERLLFVSDQVFLLKLQILEFAKCRRVAHQDTLAVIRVGEPERRSHGGGINPELACGKHAQRLVLFRGVSRDGMESGRDEQRLGRPVDRGHSA